MRTPPPRLPCSDAVVESSDPGTLGTMRATVHLAASLGAVADNFTSAMGAGGCDRMNGAFEGVKSLGPALVGDFKGLVVVVSAGGAFWHKFPPETYRVQRGLRVFRASRQCTHGPVNDAFARRMAPGTGCKTNLRYACEIQETAEGRRSRSGREARKDVEIIFERPVPENGGLNERDAVEKTGRHEAEKSAYQEKIQVGAPERHLVAVMTKRRELMATGTAHAMFGAPRRD